jgi:hypothetical protein
MAESRSWDSLNNMLKVAGGAIHFLSADTLPEIDEFAKNHGDLPVVGVPVGMMRTLRVTAVPYYLLVTPDGTVRWPTGERFRNPAPTPSMPKSDQPCNITNPPATAATARRASKGLGGEAGGAW